LISEALPASDSLSLDKAEPSTEDAESAPPSYQKTVEVTLKKGDNLFDILRTEGIPASGVHELVVAARPIQDLGRLRQGQSFTLDCDERDGQVLRFTTDLDGDHCLVVERDGEALQAHKETIDFEIRHQQVSGTISDSLFLAADDAGLPPVLILALAEIFAWDIDFQVDMRRGDTFRVLFEKKYLDGQYARLGHILAAAIMNQGEPFHAFYFEGRDGRSDYYDQDGRSLRKAFLKSPLQYRRISSGFSHNRLHPILKKYRPHLGIDYAAPLGTPVRTIGDGRIALAGWKNGYGRFIEVRHNDIYSSTYGHLHRFAKRMKKGKYVEQGQVIGYVGTTGLSTGPHLDFRLLKNGRFINPLKVNLPDADPVSQEDMAEFKKRVEELLAELEAETIGITISEQSPPQDAFRSYESKS
jgi:murein DD-endopeptidase MepM/ murein hydrolase activator NlpD